MSVHVLFQHKVSSLAALAVVALFATGCRDGEGAEPLADGVEAKDKPLDSPRPCAEGGEPIPAGEAIDGLREAGFSVKSRGACFTGVAAVLDNTGVPHVLEREGAVSCHVYDRPRSSADRTIVRREVDGGDAELVLANLECLLFTDRPDPEPGIERLEQAFRELER